VSAVYSPAAAIWHAHQPPGLARDGRRSCWALPLWSTHRSHARRDGG